MEDEVFSGMNLEGSAWMQKITGIALQDGGGPVMFAKTVFDLSTLAGRSHDTCDLLILFMADMSIALLCRCCGVDTVIQHYDEDV